MDLCRYMRPAFCPRLVKPNTSTITSISDSKFREWLESLDMTALAAAPTASHPPSSNTASKSLDVAAPPTLVDVRGRWTVMHASKVVSQENSTSINLCPGDEVRIALQNFRVMNVLYSSVAEAPQVACTLLDSHRTHLAVSAIDTNRHLETGV